MRYVPKSPAPAIFVQWKAENPELGYDDLRGAEKRAVREQLLADQGHLCAYCERRITAKLNVPTDQRMKIEHWVAQSDAVEGDAHMLDWSNMLGVCSGKLAGETTCDTARGNTPLGFHPAQDAKIDALIRYDSRGYIRSDDARLTDDLVVLNLNAGLLVRNRRGALEALQGQLQRRAWTKTRLERKLRELERTESLKPYFGALRYYLKRRIARA